MNIFQVNRLTHTPDTQKNINHKLYRWKNFSIMFFQLINCIIMFYCDKFVLVLFLWIKWGSLIVHDDKRKMIVQYYDFINK